MWVSTLRSYFVWLIVGSLARRIATYRIGAFLLSACGVGLAPFVAATAELPLMAIPGPSPFSLPPKQTLSVFSSSFTGMIY